MTSTRLRSPSTIRRRVLGAALSGAVVGLLLYASSGPAKVEGESPNDGFVRVPGIVHVHTTFSDGGGTPQEVVAAAKETGARFVVLTDHNNLDAKSVEGYVDGVLVIVGTEVSTTAGHIVGIGVRAPAFRFSGDGLDAMEDIRDLGGVAFAAHPFSARADLKFTGWNLPGPWGLELINGDSEWRSAGPRVLSAAALYAINHRRALLGLLNAPTEALAQWDLLLANRDVPGIAGADAHSRLPISKTIAPRFPSYASLFSLMRDYVLLKEPLSGSFEADREKVLEALRAGRLYIGIDAVAPAADFSFTASAPSRPSSPVTMGDTIAPSSDLGFKVNGRFPGDAVVTLLQNGIPIAASPKLLDAPAHGEGVYRVEVRIPGARVPWIISNPIYVFDRPAAMVRAAKSAWPMADAPPQTVDILDDFTKGVTLQAASDPTSKVDALIDPKGGPNDSAALSLQYSLGEGTDANRNVFVAAVDWTHRDLSGKKGLVLWIKGDDIRRVSVQVRDENKASQDEGTEWWFGSIKTSKEWRRVVIPFERLRSINPRTDGKLDLDKVRAIVFLIDRGAAKPGTKGRVWIDDVGVY